MCTSVTVKMNATMYAIQDIVGGTERPTGSPDYGTDPVYVYGLLATPRSVRWNKSRGNPDAGRYGSSAFSREHSFTVSHESEDQRSSSTPYRLPRLSPRGDNSSPGDPDPEEPRSPTGDKVWSRHGYEKIIRIPELSPQVRVLIPPPKSCVQSCRTPGTAPRFKQAAITPSCRSVPWTINSPIDDSHLQLYKSTSARVLDDDSTLRSGRFEPTPTPISRSHSPAKSVKSIHWILGHNRYHTFDRKGRSHIQGPYSREFNVTCMAPQNWLRMKLGRAKTMIN